MKRKWWFLGAAVSAALLSLCLFGVRLRIAPRWILSRALSAALTELDTRFEKSPVHLLSPALDREGCQNAEFQVETQLEHQGVVLYNMELQTQLNPSRVKALGTVVNGGKVIELALFLDENFAAVSSGELLGGNYYGITYGSFSQDIRSRKLMAALIGEKTIHQWEQSISTLQNTLSREISLPEFSLGDVPGMLYGLLALKPQVGRQEIPLSGQQVNAYTVSFRASGQEIAALVESYMDQLDPALRKMIRELENGPNAAVGAVFYLMQGKLVRIDVSLESNTKSAGISAELGQLPATDPLSLELEIQEGEDLSRVTLSVVTESDDSHYAETLCFSKTDNGIGSSSQLNYDWDLASGEMKLSLALKDRKADIRLNLAGEGETLTIRTQDAAPLLNLVLKKPVTNPVICTLTLSPGGTVAVPEYKNLAQWSMEDLLTLLTGLGGLIGLKIP